MSAYVGIDLSTKALDLVKLDEDTNRAEWVRCELHGKDAWERTLTVRGNGVIPDRGFDGCPSGWWDDVVLVAIEAPMGYGSNKLDRVVGAVAASLPAHLRDPDMCWVVRPDEWKAGLGLKGKPTAQDIFDLSDAHPFTGSEYREPASEHARDAYCLAYWARESLRRAVNAA